MTRTINFEGWESITDVPCTYTCSGMIRWAEAGYVPGYRICDGCGRHFELREKQLVPNGRRDRITPGQRRAAAEARMRADENQRVWDLLYAIQHALPHEDERGIRSDEWDGWITGDDLTKVRECEAAAHRLIDPNGCVNIAKPDSPLGIAGRLATQRKAAWPVAWAVWEEFRAILPEGVTIAVALDGSRVRLCGQWDLGTYTVTELRSALPQIAPRMSYILSEPLRAKVRMLDAIGTPECTQRAGEIRRFYRW